MSSIGKKTCVARPTSEWQRSSDFEMTRSPQISDELSELVALLKSHDVDFIVVGSHALAFHGIPRFTEDVDFFVRKTQENVGRLASALAQFGVALPEASQQQLLDRERGLIMVGRKPNRADILNFLDGLSFETAWDNSLRGELGGIEVAFLSLADFRATKLASGRPKDLADLALLDTLNP